ncbi:T9SS type B sorting domain-containing protein [Flavobacterium sp.]|uniref:T9SS type B sorting domain-containing protein n=1 Tax=Flavobacterium sp. TaxID=239 RepID=UPI002CA1FCD6|nr:T9SS type B sorting domain-containing protein [Flavobacterium sp.]HSD06536.1 T9SS type B sorting domain-containing protein [Flavobacterium sp.]
MNGFFFHHENYDNYECDQGGYTRLTPFFSGISFPGQSAICSDPKYFNSSYISSNDHSGHNMDMLVVDGSTVGSGKYFWRGGFNGQGFCGLIIGNVYRFSYWIKSVSTLVTDQSNQADIKIDFSNASDITLVGASTTVAPLPSVGWQKVTYTFKATGDCVNINLWDSNTSSVGNDFAVDDFSLLEYPTSLSLTYSISNGNCDTTLSPYNNGGTIKNFYLIGDSYSNYGGPFNNLLPGNYVLSAVALDDNIVSTNVVIPQPSGIQLTMSPDVTICSGENTTLSVSGSNTEYYWSSKPNDSNMSSHTGSSITVNPSTTTTYTANSYGNIGSGNLIYNSDFSMGNTGFGTYHIYHTTNFENVANAYGVVTDGAAWGTGFSSCGDHTTGTGNMLVVNGNDHPSAGVGNSFWSQNISVLGTTDYVFSFWIKSLSSISPGTIHVSINGSIQNVYPYLAPNSNACGDWVKYSVNFFSGWIYDGINIQLLDSNTAFFGNDFAIDDISLTAATSCSSKSVTVTVDPAKKAVISHNLTTNKNEITFNWDALPNANSYNISYTVNNGTEINAGSITTNSFTVNGLNAGDLVKIEVKPVGTSCFASANYKANSYTPCSIPLATITQQLSCTNPVGIITVSEPLGSQYQYSIDGRTFQSNPIFNNLPFGNYKVTSKNIITGCEGISGDLSLNQPGLKLPNISALYTYQNCLANLTASSTTSNTSIVWNGPNLAVNSPNPAVTPSSGIYIATVTDLATGCTNDFSLDVTAPIAPEQPSVITIQPSCFTATGSIEITTPLGLNFEYSIDRNNYQSDINFQNLTSSTYFITTKDIITGCISTIKQIEINVARIAPPVPLLNNTTICKNSISTALSAIALPDATINWYGKNATGGISSQNATIPDTSILGSTTYYCSQTLGLCESPRISIVVNVSGIALVPDFNDLKYCYGDNIPLLNTTSPNGITGSWQPSTISNTLSGTYTFTPNINECATQKNITVTINSPINISFDWSVNEVFSDYQFLTITTPISGDYLYQLDSETPQSSPVFENITHGLHSVTVIDSNGCSNPFTRNDITVINYPKFFTPNNDTFNDFWTIPELLYDPNAFIEIFDRYGKLIKFLNLKNADLWDGTYNGVLMPSSDYWFVIHYSLLNIPKTYKSHFSLIR